MMGIAYNSFFTIPYTLGELFWPSPALLYSQLDSCLFAAIEYVEESKRTLVRNIGLALALTMSGVYQPWLVKALGDWKIFNWIHFRADGSCGFHSSDHARILQVKYF